MFIGRETELGYLEERYTDSKAQLIVFYGRRRIGKTETLRQFCLGKPHVFYACSQSPDALQLANFSQRLLKEDIPAKRYISQFSNWEDAFRAIGELPYGKQKKLIVIDEFPYLCEGNPSVPSLLQNLWDSELKNQNVMIILCGSSMSFIEKELLAEKNPLYGRATGIYRMGNMSFYEAAQFFPHYTDKDKVLAYAILGGIPHYLTQFDPDRSLADNIKRAILTKGSVLYSEVEFLMHQELRETATYNAILLAIAMGNTKLNDISQKSLIDNTAKTHIYLKNLMDLGLVAREFSIDTKIKKQANARHGSYRLTDAFFRFWYAFVFPNRSALEEGDVDGVYEQLIHARLPAFAAPIFEDVCLTFIQKRQRQRALPFRYAYLGRWMGKTTLRDPRAPNGLRLGETEIDLLAIDKDEKAYLVGECKFKSSPFTMNEYLDTVAKLTPLKANADFYYALFSAAGFGPQLQALAQNDHRLMLFDLPEIVRIR